MSTFGPYARTILRTARAEALTGGSTTVEAEHLLLAMAHQEGSVPQQVLASAGLDHRAIGEALEREFAQSLAAAGVTLAAFDLPRPAAHAEREASLGASVKLAFGRAVAAAGGQRLRPPHLLLGILAAEVGTVPRALALAGVDRTELTARAQRALAGTGP